MGAYLVCFGLTAMLGRLASEFRGKWKALFCLLATLPTCILAGLRSELVGIDLLYYAIPCYNLSLKYSLFAMASMVKTEPLFTLFAWVVANLSHSLNVYLGLIQFATIAPLTYFLCRKAPNNIGLGLIVYCLVYYCWTLNIMRQGMVGGILIISYLYAEERRPLPYLVTILIACGFHTSGIAGLIIYPTVQLCMPMSNNRGYKTGNLRILFLLAIIAIVVAVVLLRQLIVNLLAFIKDTYIHYTDTSSGDSTLSALVLSCTALFAFGLVSNEDVRHAKAMNRPLHYLVIAAGALSQLSLINGAFARVGLMFFIFLSCAAAMLSESCGRKQTLLSGCIIVCVSIAYFLFLFVHGNLGNVYPYSSTVAPFLNF